MCTPQLLRTEAIWRTAGAVWWHRATLELRWTRKSVARIPLQGNSGSGSCSSRTGRAAPEKWRPGEQPKEIPEKDARKKTEQDSDRVAPLIAGPATNANAVRTNASLQRTRNGSVEVVWQQERLQEARCDLEPVFQGTNVVWTTQQEGRAGGGNGLPPGSTLWTLISAARCILFLIAREVEHWNTNIRRIGILIGDWPGVPSGTSKVDMAPKSIRNIGEKVEGLVKHKQQRIAVMDPRQVGGL
ncbi:hypothetical protein NDU88_004476 [Pleurodeles waltl]|uniref:Uncharacterized protein n=1 Tax=Pleurodeles waltl TaxID=8319 RepID=A0AAV7LLG0_PLEWA|nr:hypothetical protein NDU88_004476 [Pleurodeles waltl]